MLKVITEPGTATTGEGGESPIQSWTIAEYTRHYAIAKGCRDPGRRHYFFFKKAVGFAIVDGTRFTLRDGSCLVVPVNRAYAIHVKANAEGFVFAGEELFLRTKVAPSTFTPSSHYTATYHLPKLYNHLCTKTAEKRAKIFAEMDLARQRLGRGCDAAVMAYIFVLSYDDLIYHLTNAKPPPKEQSPELNLLIAFQALVEKSFNKHMTVAQYCKLLNTTRIKLISSCKYHINIAPLEFIRNRVLIEAKQLLTSTSLNVSEIAYSLGYEDPSYFSRFFKRYTGYSPVEYRQNQTRD